jgi:uncharacterized protein with PIN domain
LNSEEPKFILDADLFPLCKALRMLGFDALYRGNLAPRDAVARAVEERRIWIRSQPEALNLQYGIRYFIVKHSDLENQLQELQECYHLDVHAKPLAICLKCNRFVQEISREEARGNLPPRVYTFFERFRRCPACGRIYWQGSHYQRMMKKIHGWKLLSSA